MRSAGTGWSAVSLVAALLFLVIAYPVGLWACRRYDVVYGGGQGGLVLAFVVLPPAAGALAWLATRPYGRWSSRMTGALLGAGVAVLAALGCSQSQ